MSVIQPTLPANINNRQERGPAWHRSTTRKAILEAARELIERDGLEKTSLLRVAERAGFAPPTVYAYFVRKADLISAIVADDLAAFARKIKEDFPFSVMPEGAAEALHDEQVPELAPLHAALSARALARMESPNPIDDLYSDAELVQPAIADPHLAIGGRAQFEHAVQQDAPVLPNQYEQHEAGASDAGVSRIAAFEARLAELEARRVDPWLEKRLREFERMVSALEERVGKTVESNPFASAEGRLQELFERLDSVEKKHAAAQDDASRAVQDAETRLRQAHADLRTLTLETSGRVEVLERERALHATAQQMPAIEFTPHVAAQAEAPRLTLRETLQAETPDVAAHAEAPHLTLREVLNTEAQQVARHAELPQIEVPEGDHAQDNAETAPDAQGEEAGETVGADASYLVAARRAALTAQSLAQADEKGQGGDPSTQAGPVSARTRTLLSVCVGLGVVLMGVGLLLNKHSARDLAPAHPVRAARLLLPPPAAMHATDFAGVYAAALAGNPRAQLQIGLTYLQGHGVSEDDARAAHWLEASAMSGNPIAQYWLATLFEHGKGETANPSQAMRWYEAAALQGNLKAMYKLAVSYAEGWGTPQNYGEAARWFSRAAQFGFINAQYNLGVLYERGFGVPQSLADAYKWYGIAAAQGDKDSAVRVDALSSQLNAEVLASARAQVTGF
jgi:TPR repeat protein/AcrR family transcriptional regulator